MNFTLQQSFLLLIAIVFSADAAYIKASDCVNEFVYQGQTYQNCTEANSPGHPWCSMDEVYVVGSGRWRYCAKEEILPSNYVEHYECVFPFIYKNIEYTTCTKANAEDFWCSTTHEYNGDWRYCPRKANEDDVPDNIIADSNCTFPFIYHNVLYSKCSIKNYPKYWCSFQKTFHTGSEFWEVCIEGTIIQRRIDGSVSFDRNWDEYKNGFGNADGEFWLGNENLHQLTNATPKRLRIDLWDKDYKHYYAEYFTFSVGSENDNYTLSLGGYSGTTGGDSMAWTKGMQFSTKDRDNDKWVGGNCAIRSGGSGWWHKSCWQANLNGPYRDPVVYNQWKSILWTNGQIGLHSLKKVVMQIF